MNEEQANTLAELLGGESWQSGGDMWLVLLRRKDGAVVAISREAVAEYASEDDLETGQPVKAVNLQ